MNAAWLKGPHVLVSSLRRGQRFLDYCGVEHTYARPDGAAFDVHHTTAGALFGGRAHVVPLFDGAELHACGRYECAAGASR